MRRSLWKRGSQLNVEGCKFEVRTADNRENYKIFFVLTLFSSICIISIYRPRRISGFGFCKAAMQVATQAAFEVVTDINK